MSTRFTHTGHARFYFAAVSRLRGSPCPSTSPRITLRDLSLNSLAEHRYDSIVSPREVLASIALGRSPAAAVTALALIDAASPLAARSSATVCHSHIELLRIFKSSSCCDLLAVPRCSLNTRKSNRSRLSLATASLLLKHHPRARASFRVESSELDNAERSLRS